MLQQQMLGQAGAGGLGGGLGGGYGGMGGARAGDAQAFASANPMAQVGLQLGREFVQTNVARYAPGASVLWQNLRYHFDVSNAYVLAKLRRLLFPFASRTPAAWKRKEPAAAAAAGALGADAVGRQSLPNAQGAVFLAPALDDNAPDLYLPTMAFITYVLVCGLLKGTRMQFHPEVLVTTSSAALLAQILEVAALKACFFSLAAEGVSMLDLVSYTGYKYVGLTINTVVGLFLGSTAYYLSLIYTRVARGAGPLRFPGAIKRSNITLLASPLSLSSSVCLHRGAAMAFVLINTLTPILVHGDPSLSPGARSQRSNVIVACGLMQIALMWWLGTF
jgi:hypothetical protein